jgi:sugar/nucleoside kinase (ribokinase family)
MIEKRVIVAGHICLDITPDLGTVPLEEFQSLIQPGKMIQSGKFLLDGGGAVSHTGLSLHRLGAPTTLIGKIGDDLFGKKLQQILQVEDPSLGEDLVVDPSTPTSVSLILNPPGFDHSALHFHGANDGFYASDLPRALLEKADLFHFGYPPLMRSVYRGDGAELISILRRARRAGLTTSLAFSPPDPSSPAGKVDWVEVLANVLPHTDLFLPSIEDLLFLLKPDHAKVLCQSTPKSFAEHISPSLIRELAQIVLDHGVKAVMIKLGARGIYLRTAKPGAWSKAGRGLSDIPDDWHDREIWAPAFKVDLNNQTTAEDPAIGGFLASILCGAKPETAIIMAAAAVACSLESLQGIRALPKWDALLARVQNGWHVHPLELPVEEWRKDETHAPWHKK